MNKFAGWFGVIKDEYKESCKKHPVFCRKFMHHKRSWVLNQLLETQATNDKEEREKVSSFDRIMYEEYLEVLEALSRNDYPAALKELVQCIVVCFRCIFMVVEKMDILARSKDNSK